MKYDLEQRTSEFSRNLIEYSKKLNVSFRYENLLKQMISSGTSIGANYFEATHAESKKDFIHKIGICRKEAKETVYWISVFKVIFDSVELNSLYSEAKELSLIFSSIYLHSK